MPKPTIVKKDKKKSSGWDWSDFGTNPEEKKQTTQSTQTSQPKNSGWDWSALATSQEQEQKQREQYQATQRNAQNAVNRETYNRGMDYLSDTLRGGMRAMNPFSRRLDYAAQDAEIQSGRYQRDRDLYTQMAKDASTIGSQELFNRAQSGLQRSGENYDASYQRYLEASDRAHADYLERLKAENRSQYYGETLSREQIEGQLRQLEQRKAENARSAELATEAAKNDPHRAEVYSSQAGDGREPWYTRALWNVDRENDEIDAEIARYQAALRYQESLDRDNEMAEMARSISSASNFRQMSEIGRDMVEKRNQSARASVNSADYMPDDPDDNRQFARAERQEREALTAAGYVGDLDSSYIPEEIKPIYYALFAQSPAKAKAFAEYWAEKGEQASWNELYEKSGEDTGTRARAFIEGTFANTVAGLDPFGEGGQYAAKLGKTMIGGGAAGLTEKGLFNTGFGAGTYHSDLFGDISLGSAYQLGSSMLQSAANATIAKMTGGAAALVGGAGTILLGSSAAAQDYQEKLEQGWDESSAKLHALAAGTAESLFEYVSLDKLIDQDITRGFLRNILTQGGVEASEEAFTTIANRISDAAISELNGYDNQIQSKAKELMAKGYEKGAAEKMARQEWFTELMSDALGGFVSGGIMSSGQYAMQPVYKVMDAVETNRNNERTGALSSRTGEAAALAQYAADNNLEWASPEQSAEAVKIDAGGTQNDVNQSTLGQLVTEAAEKNKSRQELRQERKANRQTGADVNRARNHIQEQISGKSLQEQQEIRDQLQEKYGDGILPSVYQAISIDAAKRADKLSGSDAIREARNKEAEQIQDADMRRAVVDGYDQAVFGQAMRSGNAEEAGRYFQQLRNTGEGGMTMEATVKDQDGQSRQIAITGMTEDGKGVKLADGTTVAASKLQADADTMDAVQRIAELEMGADADAVLQAYIKADKSGVDGYRWLMDYSLAYEQGRTNKISLEEAVKRSSLDRQTAMEAYTLGQREAHQSTKSAVEALKAMPKKQGITGKTSSIDTSEIEGVTLNESEREQFEFANKIFSLIGVDVKWVASAAKNGRYVGANGSYLNGVVTLDVHAGRNFLQDVNSGILATTGHELTHFLQQYAPEQYQALKEFLFQQIVQSSANGEARFERLIWEKQRRASSKLSRKLAEDEVVADACQTMLRDSKAVQEFAKENEEAAKGIARWLDKWFGKLKQAFSRSAQLTEEASFVDGLAKEVRDAFGKLWDEALREAVETHDRVGNITRAGEQMSERDSVGNSLTSAQQDYFKDSKVRDEKGNLMVMYHGTDKVGFTVFDPSKSDDQRSLFFTNNPEMADTYTRLQNSGYNVDPYHLITENSSAKEFNEAAENRGAPVRVVQITEEWLAKRRGQYESAIQDLISASPDLIRNMETLFGETRRYDVNKLKSDYENGYKDYSIVHDLLWKVNQYFGKLNAEQKKAIKALREMDERISQILRRADRYGIAAKIPDSAVGKYIYEAERANDRYEYEIGTKKAGFSGGASYGSEQDAVRNALERTQMIPDWTFGNRYSVYLNITNPYVLDAGYDLSGKKDVSIRFNYDDEAVVTLEDDDGSYDVTYEFSEKGLKEMRETLGNDTVDEFLAQNKKYAAEHDFIEDHHDVPFYPYGKYEFKNTDVSYAIPGKWNNLEINGEGGYKTRDVAKIAQDLGHDGVIIKNVKDTGGYAGHDPGYGTIAIAFSSEQVKATNNLNPTENPDIRYSERDELASDNQVHDLTNRIGETVGIQDGNGHGETIRYSERDYDLPSDLELMDEAAENLNEAGGEEYWKALLDSVPELAENENGVRSRMKEIKALSEKLTKTEEALEKARADMKLTDRRLRTRGIPGMVRAIMKDMDAGDANNRDVAKTVTQIITNAYQKALDQIDATGDQGAAWDIVYNEGIVKAAELLLKDATHTEKVGYKWLKSSLADYYGEGARDTAIAQVEAAVVQDWMLHRAREGIRETAADRLVARATAPVQAKLNESQAKNAALERDNRKLSEDAKFWNEAERRATETAQELNEQLKELRAEAKQASKMTAEERKKTTQKITNLTKQLQAKRAEIKALKQTTKQQVNQALREKAAAVRKLEAQKEREQKILEGKLKPLAMQRMLKAVREQEAAKVKEHKDQVFQDYKTRRAKTEVRNRIKNLHAEMSRDLLRPREGHYVPKSLIGPVVDLLDMVNTTQNQTLARRLEDLERKIQNAKSDEQRQALEDQKAGLMERIGKLDSKIAAINAAYDAIKNDERYSQFYDETVKNMLVELSGTLAGRSIYDLNADELADVYTVMKAMRTTIRNAIKADLIEKGKQIWEIGDALRQELRQGKGAHAYLLEKYHMAMLSGKRAFNRFGGYRQDSTWNKVYKMLDDAQLKMLNLEMLATRIFDPVLKAKADFKKAEALTSIKEKDLVDVGLKDADGNAVKITRGMMLALYMHLQNEENMRHLMYGGMTLPDFKRYYKGSDEAWGRGTVEIPALGAKVSNLEQLLEEHGEAWVDEKYAEYKAEIEELFESVRQNIEEQLTDYDRKWIAASKDFFDNFSRRELNAVTNEMYGFSKAKVNNYFPIVTDSNFLKSEFDSISKNISLENAGFMKERVKASNPILLEDITRTVNRQISNVSRYAGLTQALKQFGNVYNVQTKGFTDSVKKAMAKSYGKNGQAYVQNLITDMIGGRSTPGTIFDRIKGNYAQAVLSANFSVTIKQAASFPTAAATVGWGPIMKALAKGGRNSRVISRADRALIDTYSPLLWKRSQGAIDTEIGDMAHAQDWTKKAKWMMGWIEKTDIATVGRLWYAAEYYVKDNFNLEKGTEEQIRNGESPFYQKVAEVFTDIVEDTQPNYTVLQRPDILRNPNKLVRAMTMFSTQRFQNANILIDAVGEYDAMRRADKKAGTEESKAARTEARKKLTRAISSQVVSAVVLNVMTLVGAALLHRMNPWRDDDDEITASSIAEEYLNGFLSTMAGSFLGGSELYEAVSSLLTGSKYYGNDVGGISTINEFATSVVEFGQKAVKLIGDEESKPEDWSNLAKKQLWKVGEYLSQMTGVPVANIRKILEGGRDHIIDAVNGEFFSFEAGVDRSNATNARRFYRAWETGDKEKMQDVLEEVRRSGKSQDSVANAFNKAAKEAYQSDEISLERYAEYLEKTGMFDGEKIAGKLKAIVKEEYQAGERSEDATIDVLTDLCGIDGDKAWKTVQEWEAKAEHADEEDYSYSQYEDLLEALDEGKILKEAGADYLAHGYTEKQITDAAVDHLKDRYLAGEISEDEAVKTWAEYKGKDENEAWMAVQRWESAAAHADEEDYSFSQYDAIDEAIAANKDIKALVKDLTDHGVEEKNITSHVKSYLVDSYVAGGVTETALKNQLSRYLGIVAKDDVDKILNDANSKKQYGVNYSSLDEEYRAGNIKASEMKNALMKYGGLSAADAEKKIRWYDLQKANPSLEISESKANAWYDGTSYTKTNGHESAKTAGMSIQDYLRAKDELAKVKGVDANNDGRTDTGSREIAYIRTLTAMSWLTDRQRRALYYEEYKGTSKTSGRPW